MTNSDKWHVQILIDHKADVDRATMEIIQRAFMSRGFTAEISNGIAANIIAESGVRTAPINTEEPLTFKEVSEVVIRHNFVDDLTAWSERVFDAKAFELPPHPTETAAAPRKDRPWYREKHEGRKNGRW